MARNTPPPSATRDLQPQEQGASTDRLKNLYGAIAGADRAIMALAPQHLRVPQLQRTVYNAAAQTPGILACTPASIVRALLQAAMLGLVPNDGRGLAYLIPFKRRAKIGDKWTDVHEVQLIPGYRGLLLLARQSGEVKAVAAQAVRAGDFFEYELGSTPVVRHRPSTDPAFEMQGEGKARQEVVKRPITHAWFTATIDGDVQITVLPWWEIERIRDRSQGYQAALWSAQEYNKSPTGPWFEHEAPMAAKTAVRAGCKLLPLSSEKFTRAISLDNAGDHGQRQAWDTRILDAVSDPLDDAEDPTPSDADALAQRRLAAQQDAVGGRPADKCDGKHPVTSSGCGAPDCRRRERQPGEDD